MKNPVEATTPHQQELWSMLLPHVIQYPTPTCAASLSLESLDRTGSANFSTTAESINIVNCGAPLETKTPSCRRRLIDGLQPANRHIQKSLGNRQQRAISADLDEGDSPASKDGPSLSLDDRSGGSDRKRVESSDVGNPLVPQIGQHRLLPGNGHKVTYSSQRSHLGNVGMDDTSSFDVRLSVDGMPADDLFTCQRIQDRAPIFSAAASTETSKVGSDGLQNSSMRTIYELRESGETVRQINDMEALLDDLNGPGLTPVGLKRARLLELARRTQEPASCRLLLDQGFDSRLLKMSASGTSDAVTDILLASIILHFVAAPFGAQAMSHLNDPSVAALFGTRLKDDNDLIDIAQSRRSNISKRILSELKDYFGAFSHSSVWRSGYPIKVSSRVIGLQGLEHLVRRRREAGCKTDILPTETIRQLVDVMPLRDAALSTPRSADQLLEIRLALSILESCTTNGAGRDVSQWAGATLAPLLAILPKLSGTSLGAGEETQRLALRLYLNLTNNNPRLCQEFARTELIRSILDVVKMHSQVLSRPATNQQNSDPAALDTLILALGTLINLVEWSAAVRHIMAGQAGKNECFLDTLVGLFAARLNIVAEVYSEEETSSNVAFGYLAVLLAYLSIDEEARAMVANQLSGGSVQQLVGVVEEFLQYHRQIEDELVLKEGDVDLRTSFVGRLEKVLARLTDVA
ncbi:MAG: hypothetical protein LQ346_000247 [Caloplaca aetnensis]|nr:MAG: hypothetical protein LQ346_000247 [Caloplaca aetnensis]